MRMAIRNKAIQIFLIALGTRLLILLLLHFVSKYPFSELASWYDGEAYLDIARSFPLPYDSPSMFAKTKFYPLFPLFIYVTNLFFHHITASAYFVVVVASSLSVVVFYNIAKDYSDRSFELAILFCFFPPQWTLVSTFVWSEPVFIFFLLLAVYFFLKSRYVLSFSSLGLVGIARPVGVIFIFSFFLFILIQERKRFFFMVKYFLISCIPFLLFHIYLYSTYGEFLVFVDAKLGYGGTFFSYPFDALITGLLDPKTLFLRKLYTSSIFVLYLISGIFALNFFRKEEYRFICLLFLPYFIFLVFLKGEVTNWGMISLPRFLIPITPFGIILVLSLLKKKVLRILYTLAMPVGTAYPIASYLIHVNSGFAV